MSILKDIYSYISVLKKYYLNSNNMNTPILYIELLKKCNLKCQYCNYNNYYKNETNTKLTLKDIKNIVNSAKKMNTKIISISGGEPLLHPKIFEIFKIINENNILIHLDTNGTHLTLENIKKIYESGVKNINISLDSADYNINDNIRRGINTNELINNIKILSEKFPEINLSINITITSENYMYLLELIDFLHSIKIKNISFNLLMQNHQFKNNDLSSLQLNKKQIEEFKKSLAGLEKKINEYKMLSNIFEIKNFGVKYLYSENYNMKCFMGFALINIDPYGYVFPCYNLNKNDDEFNINNNTLYNIIKSERFKKKLDEVKSCNGDCYCSAYTDTSLIFNIKKILFKPKYLMQKIKYILSFKK